SYRGVSKYSIDGASFQRLGVEYAKRNFDFVLHQFPRLFRSEGPQEKQDSGARDALIEFHRHWYGSDPMTKSVANGL
ncbi:MAG TPA: hypothetical protein VEO74_13975, partial [Thermoanaerobaculia bacterium]|nr:hypothetical protein [Thermoanaerobaculia bacterium]